MDSAGTTFTLWQGSAFNCSSSPPNAIILLHLVYEPGVNASCGDQSAMTVGVIDSNYTSRLTVTVNTGLDGTMINCTVSGMVLEGSDTIRVGGWWECINVIKQLNY